MNDPDQAQQAFLKRVNETLDQSQAELDADTLRELRLARSRAIETLHKPRRLWQPIAAMALTATIAAVSVNLYLTQQAGVEPETAIEDILLLTASDEMELYEELEFYQWLEMEEHAG